VVGDCRPGEDHVVLSVPAPISKRCGEVVRPTSGSSAPPPRAAGAPRPDLNAILVVDSQRYGRLTGRPFQAAGSRNSRSTHIPRRIHAKRFHAAVLANRGSGRPQALGIGILVNSRTWSLFQASLSSETAHPQRPRIKKPPPPRSRTTRMMMMMISSTALTSLRHPGRIAYDP
jgi:hypothetical protein